MLQAVLIVGVCVLAVFAVALIYFCKVVDLLTGHDAMLVAAVVLLLAGTVPGAHAADLPTDANWPSISEPTIVVMSAHNIVGDRVVLFANFCNGPREDHMHTFGVYNDHGAFVAGGCWKFEPEFTRKTKRVRYFDLNAGGWHQWPLDAFTPSKQLNVQCRGNSGDDPKTQRACNMRDAM